MAALLLEGTPQAEERVVVRGRALDDGPVDCRDVLGPLLEPDRVPPHEVLVDAAPLEQQ